VRTILCYGDSNTWGAIPVTGDEPAPRYPPDVRWPGVLRRELGPGFWVVEEGLSGRTTVWEDDLQPHRNGRTLLPAALLTHHPIDLVVIVLGTNDLKRRIGVSPLEIAEGAAALAGLVRASDSGPDGAPPGVLLVCPPPLGRQSRGDDAFEGGLEKSQGLAAAFSRIAAAYELPLVDAGAHIATSETDGVHLDAEAHETLGRALAEAVRPLVTS
jgi:lysophospholipase L1-like esterase